MQVCDIDQRQLKEALLSWDWCCQSWLCLPMWDTFTSWRKIQKHLPYTISALVVCNRTYSKFWVLFCISYRMLLHSSPHCPSLRACNCLRVDTDWAHHCSLRISEFAGVGAKYTILSVSNKDTCDTYSDLCLKIACDFGVNIWFLLWTTMTLTNMIEVQRFASEKLAWEFGD